MKLQHKIAATYIATLGIAVSGTTIGLLLGRHYQQKALAYWGAVAQEYTLLNQLQFKILHNRPAQQLSPYLQDRVGFQQAIAAFQSRLREIDGMLTKYQQMNLGVAEADLLLLRDYQQTVAAFARRLEVFGATVASLTAQPQQAFAAEKALIELTKSPEFVRFVEFQEPLMDLIDRTQGKVNDAKTELLRAESLRTQTAIYSLLLSVTIAALAAIHLSRAIARQQLTWEAERASNQQKLQESYIRLQIANDSYIIVDYKPAESISSMIKPAEFLGKPIDEILPDSLAKQCIQAIDMALLTGKTQEIEYDFLMPDGMHSYEARFIQCAVAEVFCMIRDISDRKQAAAQLQSLLSRTQLLN
jgi:PAS domain-containing protein